MLHYISVYVYIYMYIHILHIQRTFLLYYHHRLTLWKCIWQNPFLENYAEHIHQEFGYIAGNQWQWHICKVTFIGYRYFDCNAYFITVIITKLFIFQVDNQLHDVTFPVVLHCSLEKSITNFMGNHKSKHCLEFILLKQNKLHRTIYKCVHITILLSNRPYFGSSWFFFFNI